MVRVLVMLALAVSTVGCSANGRPGCCGGLFGCGFGRGNQCCEAGCGCESGGCDAGCGCETGYCDEGCCTDGGCEPSCGCSANCGGPGCLQGGCCGHLLGNCPLCQGTCCLFQRAGGMCSCSNCGASGPSGPSGNYDYSACQNGCGQGCCPGRCLCGRCETYSGCACQPQGPGCSASGDHNYNFAPGPPVGQVAYPYYTVRGPRDFLQKNPAPIGPY